MDPNRIDQIADGRLAFVIRNGCRSDADRFDLHAGEFAECFLDGVNAVAAAHAGHFKLQFFHWGILVGGTPAGN